MKHATNGSEVRSRKSEVRDQKTEPLNNQQLEPEVRGQTSEIRDQKTEVGSQEFHGLLISRCSTALKSSSFRVINADPVSNAVAAMIAPKKSGQEISYDLLFFFVAAHCSA